MRIAYVSGSAIPSHAANSVHVMKMCAAFAGSGHDVVLYARRGADLSCTPYQHYGVEDSFEIAYCDRPGVPWIGGWIYGQRVARAVQAGSDAAFDLIYGRHLYGLVAAAQLNRPIIFEAHIAPCRVIQNQFERLLFRQRAFARLVVISQVLAEDYRNLFPWLDQNRVVVAHDGADEPVELPQSSRMPRIQVSYVGQLYAGKGMEVLSQLPARLPEMDFHIVGGPEREALKWKSQMRSGNVFFHGFVPHADVGAFIGRSDIVVAPYQRQVAVHGRQTDIARWMSPLKLFEYMAHGRPIVCSDLPVLREVVTNGTNAILVPPDDIGAWIAALRSLASDSALRAKLGTQARDDFLCHYTWRARAQRVLEGV